MPSKSASISGESPDSVLPPPLKLVFIGDKVGKTTLLTCLLDGEVHDNKDADPVPVLEGFTKPVVANDVEYICLFWDTIGTSDYDHLRILGYPKTDCFVINFAINDRPSFTNIQSKWIPEIQTHCPEPVPYIIVCTKTDLKDSIPASELINNDEIKSIQEATEAYEVIECNFQDLESINNISNAAVRAILLNQERLKAIKANNSQSSCFIC